MVKLYDERRRVYCLFDKKEFTKQQALEAAKKNLKVKGSLLQVTCAKRSKDAGEDETYDVELKSGDFWCVSKCS